MNAGRHGEPLRATVRVAVWLGVFGAMATAGKASDVDLAVEWAEKAAVAAQQGDPLAAARALLRAWRWDPSRLTDRRRAVELLASRDPAAALRHARQLLADDSGFGADNPLLLARLGAEAIDRSDWRLAAALADRRREVVLARPPVTTARRAQLYWEAGRLHWLSGNAEQASEQFTYVQALAEPRTASPSRWPSELISPTTWETVATCHLAAGRVGRARSTIKILVRHGAATASVESLRARLAIAEGDPLSALRHARSAVAGESADTPSPYDLLVEAHRAANQPERAVNELRRLREERPNDCELAMALVNALAPIDAGDAWSESRGLVERLLESVEPFDPLKGEAPSDDPDGDRRTELATAAVQCLETARTSGHSTALWRLLPRLAERLGSLTLLGDAVEKACSDAAVRPRAAEWLAGLDSLDEPPAGLRRAALAIASAIGQPELADSLIRERIRAGLADAKTPQAALAELIAYIDELMRAGSDEAAGLATRWALEVVATKEEPPNVTREIAALHALRAEALLRTAGPTASPEVMRQVDKSAKRALEIDPSEIDYHWLAVATLQRQGGDEAAVDAAQEALERFDERATWTSSEPTQETLRTLRITAAMLSLQRGDKAPTVEHLERVLDRYPDDAQALATLALLWTTAGEHADRSRRMAERARAVAPEWSASWHALGAVQARDGDTADAERSLRRAIEKLEVGGAAPPVAGPADDAAALRRRHAEALRVLGRAEEASSAAP